MTTADFIIALFYRIDSVIIRNLDALGLVIRVDGRFVVV